MNGALWKRKDFLKTEEAAKTHPNRTYYYRKQLDPDGVLENCNKKLDLNRDDRDALLTRAAAYAKLQVD